MESTYKHASKCHASLFLITLNATIQLLVGLFLLCFSIWSLAHKLQYYGTIMDIKTDALFFGVPSGLLVVPVGVLTVLLRSNQLKHLIMLVILAIISLTMSFSGYFIGTIYQLPNRNQTLHLGSSIPTEVLNETLYYFMERDEMDMVQRRFHCCGVEKVTIPNSCCPQDNCQENGVFTRGCLRVIREDVAWHQHLTISFMQLYILLYFFNLSMATIVFISDRHKRKKQIQPDK